MRIIRKANSFFHKVVGSKNNISADGNYRLLIYCIIEHTDDGVLIYNTLSNELIVLDKEEYSQILSIQYLRDNWFVVPQSFDDLKFAKQYRQVRQLLKEKPKCIAGYTILTTTDCNARCFYCYEIGRAKIPMSKSAAIKVADYIIRNYESVAECDRPKCVKLAWFGGEPLYNESVIDLICGKLKEANIPFESRMTSNAYLFDKQKVEKANNVWNLKGVQITLDGTEEVYNKSKNYIHTEGSAYQRVLNNIDMLLDAHIRVVVRMNIDLYNAQDLLALTEELSARFGHRKGLKAYSHALFENSSHNHRSRTEDVRFEVYECQRKLTQLLDEKGLLVPGNLPSDIAINKCMADGGKSVVVVPTGNLGLCEHYSDDNFFSSIENPDIIDKAVVDEFAKTYEDEPICNDCAYYPLCIRLKKCEEDKFCFPEIKEMNISNIRRSMRKLYISWKAKENSEQNIEGKTDETDNTEESGVSVNC